MTISADSAGACLLRLEQRSGRLVITVVTSPDLRYRGQTRRSFSDLEEALAHVRAFAAAFRAGPPAAAPGNDDETPAG